MKVSAERLRELFIYRDDGNLIWKRSPGRSVRAGSIAGTAYIDNRNRTLSKICVDDHKYFSHRLIFLWCKGYVPEFIDHKDRNTNNNRIENLRSATRSQNIGNQDLRKVNKSGKKGVYWDKERNNWRAAIGDGLGKHKNLGRFENIEDASKAYNIAAKKHFGDFAVI